jgi:uncharacterized membrane protein
LPLLFAFALGMCAGLRSMIAPAAIAWASQFSRLPVLGQTPLSFMAAPATAYIFTALACAELVGDKLPFTPSRLTIGPLAGRVVMGALSGMALFAAVHQSMPIGGIAGGLGAGAGAYIGYHVRRALTMRLKLPDFLVALVEDAIAIAGAVYVVTRF